MTRATTVGKLTFIGSRLFSGTPTNPTGSEFQEAYSKLPEPDDDEAGGVEGRAVSELAFF